ncbi:MAG: ribosome small subunit-dependent GTPase A [Clostridium sp.]
MEQGVIVKGISGFYYVKTTTGEIIECKARGKFRKSKISPLVGDKVDIELLGDLKGSIENIHERSSELIRPNVANVDQAVVVFALKNPDVNYTLLNKILIVIEHHGIDVIICLNKADLDEGEFEKTEAIYGKIGYKIIRANALSGDGLDNLHECLKGKITVFAGPSGVGKSTITNRIQGSVVMETGGLSKKISRGRHTTRHAQLIEVTEDTFVLDTPGFSSMDLSFIKPSELQYEFKEFKVGECKFTTCLHNKEIGCRIKQDVEDGIIPVERYTAYLNILKDLEESSRRGNR